MPRDDSIRTILVIGSGPIVIGQACEFDYSGTQAVRVLADEGYRVVLINSNPATIMTDPDLLPGDGHRTYIEPLTLATLTRIVQRERPDAVLPTVGGQTAINLTLEGVRAGLFDRFGVRILGANRDALELAEDRLRFKDAMVEIGLDVPRSSLASSLEEADAISGGLGFPVVVRASYTLGGMGSGLARTREDFLRIAARGLELSPVGEVLVEESALGWHEFELEVMRDRKDQAVVVCSIENLDPMGVHTGDSITVAPAMTLTDREYQRMRDQAFAVIRRVGVDTGGSNIQFAVHPETRRMVVIEIPDARDLPDRILRLAEPRLGARASLLENGHPMLDVLTVNEFTPLLDDVVPGIQDRRRLVTTHSYDLPTFSPSALSRTAIGDINTVLANAKRQDPVPNFPPRSMTDLLAARLQAVNGSKNGLALMNIAMLAAPNGTNNRGTRRSFDTLLSPELLAGLRMDLNRPFGNGRDDVPNNAGTPGRGIVDEPLEFRDETNKGAKGQMLWDQHPDFPELAVRADGDNDGIARFPADGSDPYAHGIFIRQLYARHLYVLARLVLDAEYNSLILELEPHFADHALPRQRAEAEAARRFAQWAINVVDYRDPDSIMTPFPYDIHPFRDDAPYDGYTWDIVSLYQSPTPGRTGIVWGMERPELLITETLATHDRRTRDIDISGEGTKAAVQDPHFDQLRRPVGSLFVELFNPNGLNEHTPAEFYEGTTNKAGVHLNKMVPGGKIGGSRPVDGDPIWRMAIIDPDKLTVADKKNRTYDPEEFRSHPNLDDIPNSNNFIQRTVFFTNKAPGANVRAHSPKHYHRTGTADIIVQPQQYAVIGPADKTDILGDQSPSTGFEISIDELGNNPRPRETGVRITGMSYGYPASGDKIRQAAGVVINSPRRLSISEPYPNQTGNVANDTDYDTWEKAPTLGNSSLHQDVQTGLSVPMDEPWDDGARTWQRQLQFTGTDTGKRDPENASADFGYRIVALQRLADPTRLFDAQANPYLTVDSLPVDLTVYNSDAWPPGPMKDWPDDASRPLRFGSRQRDGTAFATGLGQVPNLWQCIAETPKLNDPADDTIDDGSGVMDPVQTLGYLNLPYSKALGGRRTRQSLGDLPDAEAYTGAPGKPFSSFNWPNRPFVSNTELLNVPWAGSAEMFSEYSLWPDDPANTNPPDPYTNPGTAPDYDDAPNRHLVNFYHSDRQQSAKKGLNFHRVLEYLHVPSRFAGTKEMLPPASFVDGNHTLHPPFNFLSRFREPGRVNINTMLDRGETLRAMMNDVDYLNAAWGNRAKQRAQKASEQLLLGRRGYPGGSAAEPLFMDPMHPTFFANPFRSYNGGNLVPIDTMRQNSGGQYRDMVESTLLRPDPTDPDQPLFTFDPQQPYLNGDTNANVRNLVYQKLGNMVTTRSNVYAIWITMGYFEVEPVNMANPTIAAAYPDGYRLKQELGVDTGEIERHRAFYIVDRTIPVGFLRGEDLNVEKTILLKRFIE